MEVVSIIMWEFDEMNQCGNGHEYFCQLMNLFLT